MDYLYLLVLLFYLIQHGHTQNDHCFPPEFLDSVSLTTNITKAGFHRDLHYTLRWSETDHEIKALLVQKMPSGVYMDEYELETLRRDTGLEVLLDAMVDLEAPEYLATGFTALVFLPGDGEATVPIHGRYHRPSETETHVTVELEPPRVLLTAEPCSWSGLSAVEAPCSVKNDSACWWLEVQSRTVVDPLRLRLPVGDATLLLPVCVVTFLTAALGCVYLLITIWRHGSF